MKNFVWLALCPPAKKKVLTVNKQEFDNGY
jgi:hypothetical protein